MRAISVRVPASTSNLGPGFDTLGLALRLYNTVTVTWHTDAAPEAERPMDMVLRSLEFFKKRTGLSHLEWDRFGVHIHGEIPISRGLGSSVTVRLGVLLGVGHLLHSLGHEIGGVNGWGRELVLDWVIELEGHPDNAVASCLGGLGICSRHREENAGFGYTRFEVGDALEWIALVPELELSTEEARGLLPKEISLKLAVENVQRASRLAVVLATGRYGELRGLFVDHFHQPFRAALIPGFTDILGAAEKAGALGSFLSGAGSTLMAVALKSDSVSDEVGKAMLAEAERHGLKAKTLTMLADNEGARVI